MYFSLGLVGQGIVFVVINHFCCKWFDFKPNKWLTNQIKRNDTNVPKNVL
jgi:hypothetical protein